MSEQDYPLFQNTRPLALLTQLQKTKQEFVYQPIVNSNGTRIEIPVNHNGGTVNCVLSFEETKRSPEIECKICRKKFQVKDLYYDLSLDMMIREVRGNDYTVLSKAIKLYKNGTWEACSESAEELIKPKTQTQVLIEETFRSQESQLRTAIEAEAKNQKVGISVQQNPEFVQQVINEVKKINFNGFDFSSLGDIIFSRVFAQNDFERQIKNIEVIIFGTKKSFYVRPGIIGSSKNLYDVTRCSFNEESKMFVSGEYVIVVGGLGEDKKQYGLDRTFVISVREFLESSAFWQDHFQYIPFYEVAKLNNRRNSFQLAEHGGYLYVLGGFKKAKTFDDASIQPGRDTLESILSFQSSGGKDDKDMFQMPVRTIERIKISDIKNGAKWEIVSQMPVGLFEFHCVVAKDLLILSGGATISYESIFSQIKGNQTTFIYNFQTKQWRQVEGLFPEDNIQPTLISSFKNPAVIFATGGLGKYQENRWEFANNKKIMLYHSEQNKSKELAGKLLPEYFDKLYQSHDLYERNLVQRIITYLSKRDNLEYETLLIRGWTYMAPSEDQFRTNFTAYEPKSSQFIKVKIF